MASEVLGTAGHLGVNAAEHTETGKKILSLRHPFRNAITSEATKATKEQTQENNELIRDGLRNQFENPSIGNTGILSGSFIKALNGIAKMLNWLGDIFNAKSFKNAGKSLAGLAAGMAGGTLINQGPNLLSANTSYKHSPITMQPAPIMSSDAPKLA